MNAKNYKNQRSYLWAIGILILSILGFSCDRLKGGSSFDCTNECQKGLSVCDPSGGKIICEGPNSRGCTYWGTVQACLEHQTCKEGTCICENPCSLSDSMCSSETEQQSCVGPDQNGCMFWSEAESCGEAKTCRGGSCECQNPCQENQSICDSLERVLHCLGPDVDNCMYWSTPETCIEHQKCIAGACDCANPCNLGDVMCYQQVAKLHCAGPDATGCMYWNQDNLELCPKDTICSSEVNDCIPATPAECQAVNECNYEGQKTCMTSTQYRECHYRQDGCLVWDCST